MTELSKLPQLAMTVNEIHRQVMTAVGQALTLAKSAGDTLLQVKGSVAHGQFQPWVEQNCECSLQTARGYMRVAKNWELIESKRAESPDLSIRRALELIAIPDPGDDSKGKRAFGLNENSQDIDAEFERHIAIVKEYDANMRAAVESMRRIRDGRLYEETHTTFEDWALDRFGLSPQDLEDAFREGMILPPLDILPSSVEGIESFSIVGEIVADSVTCIVETDPRHRGFCRCAALVNDVLNFTKKPIKRDCLGGFVMMCGIHPRKIKWNEPEELLAANNPMIDLILESIAEDPDGKWYRNWWKYPAAGANDEQALKPGNDTTPQSAFATDCVQGKLNFDIETDGEE